MTLLDRVADLLSRHNIAHALIGAAALAAHGVSRSTFDRDLLVTDEKVLEPGFWSVLAQHASADVRRGDADDPLRGVVRLSADGDRDVDVVVGRASWHAEVLQRAEPAGTVPLAVVQCADLVLLKLYAGGSQDRWDIEQLLALDGSDRLVADVSARIAALPPAARQLWQRIVAGSAGAATVVDTPPEQE